MPVLVLVLLVAVTVALALLTKPRKGSERRRFPKPGEGLRRRDLPTARVAPPEGMVTVRHSVPAGEAHVVLGLLQSAGLDAGMIAARSGFVAAKGLPSSFDVLVAAEHADEARALLDRA